MLWLRADGGSILKGPTLNLRGDPGSSREQWLPCSTPPSSPQRLGGPEIMSWGHQEALMKLTGPPSGEGPAFVYIVNFPSERISGVILLLCFWPQAWEFDTS